MPANDVFPSAEQRFEPRPREIRRCLTELASAHHAPSLVYTSPAVFELEKKRLFMKDWLCVARVEEVENPGDYLTHDIMGEPIIVARNSDGVLHAYYNMCAHRGAELVQGRGNVKRLKCPYHAWTYDLAGQLVGAPFMKETKGFDIADCRLRPLRLDTWAGWIFVSFDPNVAPLINFLASSRTNLTSFARRTAALRTNS